VLYLWVFLSVQTEAESSQADRPEVSAAKQQVAQSYADFFEKRNQPADPKGPTALEAVSEDEFSEGGSQSASHFAAGGDASDTDGEGTEESNDNEDNEGEEGEEGEGEQEEHEQEEYEQNYPDPDSEADSSSSPDVEEVE